MNQNTIIKSENEHTVKINGIKTSYAIYSRPHGITVVFLHGFPFNKSMWNNQVTALKDSYQVVTYDLRGHGLSEAGNDSFSIDLFLSDLIGLLDHLNIDKAILCGLSLGGYISLNAVSKYPDRIKGLVLSDTQCFADTQDTKDKRTKAVEMLKNGGLQKYASDSLGNLFAPGSFITRSKEVEDVRQMILTTAVSTLCNTLIALAERVETCTILNGIRVPVLIMSGTEDKITPPEVAKYMNENIKDSSLQIIEHAGHLSNMENPEKFNEHLNAFLATFR